MNLLYNTFDNLTLNILFFNKTIFILGIIYFTFLVVIGLIIFICLTSVMKEGQQLLGVEHKVIHFATNVAGSVIHKNLTYNGGIWSKDDKETDNNKTDSSNKTVNISTKSATSFGLPIILAYLNLDTSGNTSQWIQLSTAFFIITLVAFCAYLMFFYTL